MLLHALLDFCSPVIKRGKDCFSSKRHITVFANSQNCREHRVLPFLKQWLLWHHWMSWNIGQFAVLSKEVCRSVCYTHRTVEDCAVIYWRNHIPIYFHAVNQPLQCLLGHRWHSKQVNDNMHSWKSDPCPFKFISLLEHRSDCVKDDRRSRQRDFNLLSCSLETN